MILFLLEKKTSVRTSIFTAGHKLMINRVLRHILVNQILMCQKVVKL
jgi:hypothetical protein